MAISLSKIYEDATTVMNETAVSSFDVAAQMHAGLVESICIKFTCTQSSASLTAASAVELIKGLRFVLNGDQLFNLRAAVVSNANTGVGAVSAMAQDMGGRVDESGSATVTEFEVWIPAGVRVPANSRMELAVDWGVSAVAPVGPKFSVWARYNDQTSNATIIGNATTDTLGAASQTQINVKIPVMNGATVTGIIIQGPANTDTLTGLIIKSQSDFDQSATQIRGNSGAGRNGYQFFDAGVSTTANQFSNLRRGYYFVPMFGLTTDGSATLLITDSAGGLYTFTPVLSLPTGGGQEAKGRQTSIAPVGSAKSVLQRAED